MITSPSSILILTNDLNIDSSIGFTLKQLRYSYIVVHRDYIQAMKLLSTWQIKCILLPLWDDELLELAEAIKQAYFVPYVFYTTYFTPQILHQIKEIPPPVYLARAYNKDELYVTIELACHKHHSSNDKIESKTYKSNFSQV